MFGADFGAKYIDSNHLDLGRLGTRESIPCLSEAPCLVLLGLCVWFYESVPAQCNNEILRIVIRAF